MERGQQEFKITINVIDDNQWEPDETFFVKLSLPEGSEKTSEIRFTNSCTGYNY